MGFALLSLLLGGDLKKKLKNLTVEDFYDYVKGRTEGVDDWTPEQEVAGRQMFDEFVAMFGLRKILKKGV